MPQLGNNGAALGMHGLGHILRNEETYEASWMMKRADVVSWLGSLLTFHFWDCSLVQMPGTSTQPRPRGDTWIPSVMINPAELNYRQDGSIRTALVWQAGVQVRTWV